MELLARLLTRERPAAWMVLCGAGMIISLWFPSHAGAEDEVNRKLAAGEIMVSTQEVPGKSLQSAEMVGVIDAPPEIVWQVINDVNNFKNFMPRTRSSMAVAPEKIPLILQKRPTRAAGGGEITRPYPGRSGQLSRSRGYVYRIFF